MGLHIKLTLSKRQGDGLIVKRPTREYHIEVSQPDFRRLPATDQGIKTSNVVDFARFKEKTNKPSDLSRNEILLQCNMSIGDTATEPIRNVVISRYRQAQENSIYLKNKPAIEIKI